MTGDVSALDSVTSGTRKKKQKAIQTNPFGLKNLISGKHSKSWLNSPELNNNYLFVCLKTCLSADKVLYLLDSLSNRIASCSPRCS